MNTRETQLQRQIDHLEVQSQFEARLYLNLLQRQREVRQQQCRNYNIAAFVCGAVCQFYGIDLPLLTNCTRRRCISEPRQMAMKLIRENTTLTWFEIRDLFNKRAHATIILNIYNINDLIYIDRKIRTQYKALEAEVKEYIASLDHAAVNNFFAENQDNN